MNHTRPLTVGERIAVHLSQYLRVQDEYVVPTGMSQEGIATSLRISRAHAAIELKRAMAAGRVEMRVGHVAGRGSRRKIYRLTSRGEGLARAVRERAFRRTVEVVLPDGAEALPGLQAIETLRRHGVPEARAVLMLLSADQIDVQRAVEQPALAPPARPADAESRAREAFEAAFVRPYEWQRDVVLGPPYAPPVRVAA